MLPQHKGLGGELWRVRATWGKVPFLLFALLLLSGEWLFFVGWTTLDRAEPMSVRTSAGQQRVYFILFFPNRVVLRQTELWVWDCKRDYIANQTGFTSQKPPLRWVSEFDEIEPITVGCRAPNEICVAITLGSKLQSTRPSLDKEAAKRIDSRRENRFSCFGHSVITMSLQCNQSAKMGGFQRKRPVST